ncbi:hypothetical protein CBS101457_005814 [Exobasidium rhododendri]|nr:hypothetical protein CBS101457_005814 [Exobasidium rhododendri]
MPPTTRSGLKRGAEEAVKATKRSSGSSSSSSGSVSSARSVKRAKKAEDFTLTKNKTKDGLYPMNKFPYHLDFKNLDLRKHPHLYRPGLGEQGVLMVEPYKAEILPFWKFKDPPTATKSSIELQECFDKYIEESDFVGADMARKFIQMGFTRSRRYANHAGGRKYSYKDGKKGEELPRAAVEDKVKAESAEIFKAVLEKVKVDERYLALRQEFEEKWKDVAITNEGD